MTTSTASAPASAIGDRWYRQPILWLGAAIFFASLAGCIHLIILGSRYADEPMPVASEYLLKMPTRPDSQQ